MKMRGLVFAQKLQDVVELVGYQVKVGNIAPVKGFGRFVVIQLFFKLSQLLLACLQRCLVRFLNCLVVVNVFCIHDFYLLDSILPYNPMEAKA
jgi:hypothetical protein